MNDRSRGDGIWNWSIMKPGNKVRFFADWAHRGKADGYWPFAIGLLVLCNYFQQQGPGCHQWF